MARKLRKQKVALRFKRREQLKDSLRTMVVRSAALALVVGFAAGLVAGRDSFVPRFIHRHTPDIDVQESPSLIGLPVLTKLPNRRFWLWLPGSALWLERRICRDYPAVRSVSLERSFEKNRVRIHLEPRVPLVSWNGSGLDQDGVLFAITPGTWDVLAQASFLEGADKRDLGRWLFHLAGVQGFWPQVVSIHQDLSEGLSLTLKTGTRVIWGPLETGIAAHKAQTLVRVLDDAHKNMGGAARADLRFFDQGRIIVLPKGR